MSRRETLLAALVIVMLALAATPALAGKGGNGKSSDRQSTASCTVEGNVVHGAGLPTDELLNFMVTDASGTWGWVLGYTDDGTWSVMVPTRSGPTAYEFASRTWGPDGTKYTVFASCSA